MRNYASMTPALKKNIYQSAELYKKYKHLGLDRRLWFKKKILRVVPSHILLR